jgi:hypothetical protein
VDTKNRVVREYLYDFEGTFEVNGITQRGTSEAEVFKARDVADKVYSSVVDDDVSIESNDFTDSIDDLYITNGYKIRDYDGTVTESTRDSSIYTSFDKLVNKWLIPHFGAGYALTEDELIIDRFDRFYNEKVIMTLPVISDGTYSSVVDMKLFHNEIETGYKLYPKATDENTDNNMGEFNTIHKYLSPLRKVKSKLNLVSDYIASGFKIENQRREQFSDKPKDTVTDDDKIFVIEGKGSGNDIDAADAKDVMSTYDQILDPDGEYNIGLNPRTILLNNAEIYNSGFFGKAATEVIKPTEVKINEKFRYRFKSGQGSYCADTSGTRRMSDNTTLETMDSFKRKFSGMTHGFSTKMPFEDVLFLRYAMLNQAADPSDNFGAVEFDTPSGTTVSGWIMEMTYNPFNEEVEFTVRSKGIAYGNGFDYTLDLPLA